MSPLASFTCPQTLRQIPLAEAPAYFEQQGLCPSVAIRSLLAGHGDPRRGGCHLSPSMLDPETTCRMEICLQRFRPYSIGPLDSWLAQAGTVWHRAFQAAAGDGGEWLSEVRLPAEEDEGRPGVRRCEDGVLEVETLPGVWLSGIVDRVRADWTELIDFKTQRWSKTDYGARPGWGLQLNLYREMIERLRGVKVERLGVWRLYEGTYDVSKAWRYFPIGRIEAAALEARVGEFARSLAGYLAACEAVAGDEAALDGVLRAVPMDGKVKGIFNGKKCTSYCATSRPCAELCGGLVF